MPNLDKLTTHLYNIHRQLKLPYQEWLRDGPDETRQPADFGKVPIPAAETSEDEASMKLIPLALKGRVFC